MINSILIIFQSIYSQQETRFNVSIDYSEFITGSEEMMRSMDRFHVSTEEVFESLATSSVKLDATLSESLDSQVRQLENYRGIVKSVETAISGSGEQIEEAYRDIARTAQEAAKAGATRLIFDVEGAKVQVDLYKKIIDDFLNTISALSAGVKLGSVTTKEAARSLFEFREAHKGVLSSEFIDQLNRTRMSLITTTKDTDGAAKKINELGSAMKEVSTKDVTFRFKVDPENIKQIRNIQDTLKDLVDDAVISTSSLSEMISDVPQDFPPIVAAFQSIATEARNVEEASNAFVVVKSLLKGLQQTSNEITFSSIQEELENLSQSQTGQVVAEDLTKIINVVRDKTAIETFAESIRGISVDITSIEDLRNSLTSLTTQFAQVPQAQKYINPLHQLIDAAEEGRIPIETVKKNIFDLSKTISSGLKPEKALSDIISITDKLGEQPQVITTVKEEFRKLSALKLETPEDIEKFITSVDNIKRKLEFRAETQKASNSIEQFATSLSIIDTDPVVSGLEKLSDKYQFVRTTFQKELDIEPIQAGVNDIVQSASGLNNIQPIIADLRSHINQLPESLSGVAQGFELVATTGKKLADMQDTGKLLISLMGNLKTEGITSFESITNSIQGLIENSHLGNRALGDLRGSFIEIRQEIIKEAELKKFGEALVLAAKQPSASMIDLEGNVKGVLNAFKGWEKIEGVTDDVAGLLEELGKTESVQKARQDILSFGRALTEGVNAEELREKIETIGASLAETGEDTSKVTSILNKFANANIKTAGDADRLNSEIRRTANNLSTMGEETKASDIVNKLSESITKSKVDKFGKDITKLTDKLSLTSDSLVNFKDNLLRVGNRYEGMAPSITNINNLIGEFDEITRDLISEGLPQLAGRFKGISEEAKKRLGLAYVSEELEKVNALLSTGDIEDAELSIRDLSSSTQLSGNQFKDLRTNLNQLSDSLEEHNNLIEATSKVKQIISNKSIGSVTDLREELKKARSEFENTKGLEEFNESLNEVIESSGEFKKVEHLRKALHGLTTIETKDIDVIQSAIKGLGDEAEKDVRSIEDLVEDLRKLGVSPQGLRSIEKAEESLRKVHGTARKKRVVDTYAKSVEKTADKLNKASTGAKKFSKGLGNINKNVGGMRKIFSAMDAQMSRLLIRFGVYGVIKGTLQGITKAVIGLSKGIFSLTKESAKLKDTSTAFRVLASQTTSAELALAQVRSAAGGVIDEFELMASATRAAIAGLPVERIDDFMRGARALGPLVGRDIPEAFDRLTSAAIKQERRLLDELGIVIRANDAYKEYARTHKTTVAALSATEKQMAFTDAIIASVNEKILRLGGNLDQAQRPFLRFESAWKDLRIAMGDWLSESLNVPDVLDTLTTSMKDFSFSMADASKQSAILAASTLAAYESFKKYSNEFIGSVPRLVKEAQRQIAIAEAQTSSIVAQYDAETRLAEIVKTLSTAFPGLSKMLEVDVASGLREVAEESERLRKTFQAISVIRMTEAFQASIRAYREASASLVGIRKELDLLIAARNKMIKIATPAEIKAVDEEIKKRNRLAIILGSVRGQYGMISSYMAMQEAQRALNLIGIEANIEASTNLTAALMEEQVGMRSQREIMKSLIKSQIDLGNIKVSNISDIINIVDAYEEFKLETKDVTFEQFLMNKELGGLATAVDFISTNTSGLTVTETDLRDALIKVRAVTGLTNKELADQHELLRTIINDLKEGPTKIEKWEAIYKQFETLTKTYNKFRTQFEPTEFMIEISPSERSKIELKRMEKEYESLFNLLAKGLEITIVPVEETNKAAAARQLLNELLGDYATRINQLSKGETDLAKNTLEGIDERLEAYKLDKTQIDELNILSNKRFDIQKKIRSIDKQTATERIAQTEAAIASIKEGTKNQISAYGQIIATREALVSSLKALGILSYEQESQLLKKIAQDRIAEQKAIWADEQKRMKDRIKRQLTFANTMSGMISNVYGANKEAIIDMLGEVSAMGTEVFKLDIKPGEIAPEKLIEGFEKIKDIKVPGLEGIDDKTVEISKKVVATLAEMLTQAGDQATEITEKTIRAMEDTMREYLISLHAKLTEMSAMDNAYLSDKQAVEKALITLSQNRIKREMSDEKARMNFLIKSEKDILAIKKSTNKDSIKSRVEATKIEFKQLRLSIRERADILQAIQDIEIAAHETIFDINLKNTREYLQKIRRATRTEQLVKIRDEYSAEELGEINKLRLRSEYADKFQGLLDDEIDKVEANIQKRQAIEEAAAIARVNIAKEETKKRIEELIKLAEAEGKPEEIKRLQELLITSQEVASSKITAIIKEASRKRRMEALKLRKGIAGNEEELARLTINAQMDNYVETNRILLDLTEDQKQKHLEDISRLREATNINQEELAKRNASLQEVLKLEAIIKDNLANANILREQLIAEAIRKIREKEFNEYQSILRSTADVLGETSKIAFEIRKNLIIADAAEREKDLEKAKNIAIRRMRREISILNEQNKKKLEIEEAYTKQLIALQKATQDELLENTRGYNRAVAEGYQETFNTILESFEAFTELMIADDQEMIEDRKNLHVTFWRDQLTSVRKNSTKMSQLNQHLADKLYEIDMKSSERRVFVIANLTDAVENAGNAIVAAYSGDIKGAIGGFVGMVRSIKRIFDDATERRKEALERAKEEFKALKSEWRAAGADLGRSIAQAITDNLEVDWDELVRGFMRAALAAQMGQAFAEMFGPSIDMIKDALAVAVGKGERYEELLAEDTKNVERVIDTYEHLQRMRSQGIPYIAAAWAYEQKMADILEPYRKGVPIEKIAADITKSKHGLGNVAKGIGDLTTTFTEMEPEMREVAASVNAISGIFEEAAENAGLRTLRAITEPQANQIIVLLGRQVDHLAMISSNTTTLVKGLSKKEEALPQPIELSAPAINNDIIPDKIQIEPTFNIEPALPNIINEVASPEVHLAPRILTEVKPPEVNVTPIIFNEVETHEINLAPNIVNQVEIPAIINNINIPTISPNIINEIDTPEINMNVISEIDVPEIIHPTLPDIDVSAISSGLDIDMSEVQSVIDISTKSIAQLALIINDDTDKVQIEPIFNIEPALINNEIASPLINVAPMIFNDIEPPAITNVINVPEISSNITNEIDVPETNVNIIVDAPAIITPKLPDIINNIETPEVSLAPQIITQPVEAPLINLVPQITQPSIRISFNPDIEPIIPFSPNIVNEIDIPEINIFPRIINEMDISRVIIITPVDLSQRTIAQLAPAITTPQVQYIERLVQPQIIQKEPEYHLREEVSRIERSEHKEEIKVSISINDQTVAVSEDGMLVDAIIPMLMEEESRMKMRREKAVGRRVYNRARV